MAESQGVFVSHKWRNTIHELTASPKDILGTLGGFASVVSLVIALVALK